MIRTFLLQSLGLSVKTKLKVYMDCNQMEFRVKSMSMKPLLVRRKMFLAQKKGWKFLVGPS